MSWIRILDKKYVKWWREQCLINIIKERQDKRRNN